MATVTLTSAVAGQVCTAVFYNNNQNAIINQVNGNIDSTNLAALAVTGPKIATGAVSGPKIAMGSDAQGDILFRGAANYQRLAAGTSGQVLMTQGAGANPIWDYSTLIQVVYSEVGGTVSGSTAIPNDDSIPTWAEGDDTGIVCTITPKSATNILLVIVRGVIGGSTSQAMRTFTLFKDPSGTDACIRSCPQQDGRPGGASPDLSLTYSMVAGGTSATSFKLRFGASTGTVYLNASYGVTDDLGGTAAASMTVYEIKA